MPKKQAKLARFVKVMTGGKVVGDELVSVRDNNVGLALDGFKAEIDRLAAAGMRSQQMDDLHRDLTQDRVDANALGSNRDICQALETVKFNARGAAADSAELVDDALQLQVDQAEKLAEVDAVLNQLKLDEAALTVPVLKTPVTALVGPLQLRRDALADADEVADIETQIADQPALLNDIADAQSDADQAKADVLAVANRKAKLDTTLVSLGNWLAVLKPGIGQTDALTARRDTLALARTALDTPASVGALGAGLGDLEAKVSTLATDVRVEAATRKRESADKWLAAFKGWETAIGKISSSNPVTGATAALRLEKTTADAVVDAAGRHNALSEFMTKAAALQTKVQDMQAAKTEIEKLGLTVAALLTVKPPPVTPPTVLEQQKEALRVGLPAAFALGTVDAVIARLAAMKTEMIELKPKVEEWRAGQLDLDKQKASAAKSLADARAAVDKLAAGTPKTDLDAALKALVLRQTTALTLTAAPAQQAFYALGKDALALLEKAQKQLFAAQITAPDGKQKLDELIKGLGDKAADPQAEATCRAALAARFNLDVEILEGLSVDRLPRLYNLFAQVPAAHVGHAKIAKLEYNTDPSSKASYYQDAGAKIVLMMPESDSDFAYKAQTGNAVEMLNYFSATALHEIGHGVDAKDSIMSDSRMATADFGGWQKVTIDSVAQAHYAANFASRVVPSGPTATDLQALVKTVLETGTCKKPANATAPLGSLHATWAQIIASQGYKNLVAIRDPGKKPWDKPVPVGTRAYHEGYDGNWFSYLVAERAKGISNYQWRAPPEWFAEWYAYYHLTKKAIPASLDTYIKG